MFGPGTPVPKAAREVLAAIRDVRGAARGGHEPAARRGVDAPRSAPATAAPSRRRSRSSRARAPRTRSSRQADPRGARARRPGRAVRVGVTGPPGVGKSTLIEALGLYLVERGQRVAVLAVDPSEPGVAAAASSATRRAWSGSRSPIARSSGPRPRAARLGGVAHRTREAMLVCEAAGHDVVIVETVGVGQSEIGVHSMVDFFAVLLQPGAGDALQGMKRGVLELADALVVTKADGDQRALAERTRARARPGPRAPAPDARRLDAARPRRERRDGAGDRRALGARPRAPPRARGLRRARRAGASTRPATGCGAWSRRAWSATSAPTRPWPGAIPGARARRRGAAAPPPPAAARALLEAFEKGR